MKKMLCLLAVLFFCTAAAPVGAAGWYLRGNLGFEWSLAGDFSDEDATSPNPPNFFGTVPGNDGRSIGAYGDFGRFPSLEAALGKRLASWLRGECAMAYRPELRYRGEANFQGVPSPQPVTGRADTLTALAQVLIDVAPLFDFDSSRFQPYLGAGLGVSYNRMGEMTYLFPSNPGAHKVTVTPSGDHTDLAMTACIGTGIVLSHQIVLDVGYRYTDLGRIYTDAGKAYLDTRPTGILIGETWAPLRVHGIYAGLRYLFP